MGRVAFLFAGQGAQYPGMGQSLYERSAAAREVFDEAERLRPGTRAQCFAGDKEALSLTINTQPCLMATDCACAAALMEAGMRPDGLAGFSLGEIAALPFAGLLSFAEAFRLVTRRAALMQACAERVDSGMVAVLKLDDAAVEALCGLHGAYAVNYNSPGQGVCALRRADMPAFADAVKARGGRALSLAVSGGFHSPFMHEAAVEMAQRAQGLPFAAPALPLYANRSCEPYTAQDAPTLLGEQIESPVRWTTLIRCMLADGFTDFVEVGAGKTLSGLVTRIGGARFVTNVENAETLAATIQTFKEAKPC